jgi:hypothetical protein
MQINHKTGVWVSLDDIVHAMQETALTYQFTADPNILQLSYDLEDAFQEFIEALNDDYREEEKYNVNWFYIDVLREEETV